MAVTVLVNGEGGVGVPRVIQLLKQGASALDAVESGVRIVEEDPSVRTVGLGGSPNILGEIECDAAIMCGRTLQVGSVGALKGFLHPVSVARHLMEHSPHVMVAGEGAARYAREIGAQAHSMLTGEAQERYRRWIQEQMTDTERCAIQEQALMPIVSRSCAFHPSRGTTIFLVRTTSGAMAGAVSTSGWAYKYPGRLGDSPVIGAGLYVDQRYGAAACTHTGEMTIRAGTARAVVAYMKKGAPVEAACREAFDDLRALQCGYLGPVVLHAMDASGACLVLSTGNDGDVPYWYWDDSLNVAEKRKPLIERLSA